MIVRCDAPSLYWGKLAGESRRVALCRSHAQELLRLVSNKEVSALVFAMRMSEADAALPCEWVTGGIEHREE